MNCPACGGETIVVDTRGIYRRRECAHDGLRFSTVEVLRSDYDRLQTIETGVAKLRDQLDIDLSTRPGALR